MHNFPTLYKTNSRGKCQAWTIFVEPSESGDGFDIVTEHGQLGGKTQTARVAIRQGKNIGKANETSSLEQALSEAQAKWKKQLDKGYSEEIKAKPKLRPMLAKSYADHPDKMPFPCYWQPKLDGLRCLAYWDGDEVVLESRNGKRWKSLLALQEVLSEFLPKGIILDGELYVHGEDFQKIVGAIKRDKPSEDSARIQYHVYDMVDTEKKFDRRLRDMGLLFSSSPQFLSDMSFPVKRVFTEKCDNADDIARYLNESISLGYEGIMLRNPNGLYECDKRSFGLLKVKTFLEGEFEIVGVVQGKGKAAGQATFVCKTPEGDEFRCTPEGDDALRRKYWNDRDKLVGRNLTVKFFSYTSSEQPVPRFPIGKAVRDYE